MPDDSLLFYSGLLALHAALGDRRCEQILGDYFEVPVEVEQFVGAWYPLDRSRSARSATSEGYLGAAWASAPWWATRSGTSSRACASSWGR